MIQVMINIITLKTFLYILAVLLIAAWKCWIVVTIKPIIMNTIQRNCVPMAVTIYHVYFRLIFLYIFLLDFLLNFSLAKMNRHINRSGSFLKFTTHWCCAPYQVLYINKYVLILDIKRSHESHGLYEALDPSNELQFRLTQHWCTPFGRRNCLGNCCEVKIVR